MSTTERTIADHEAGQVERANASRATPVVFVHGLWLLPSSWERWVAMFEEAGFVGVTPGWPDDPETVAEARVPLSYDQFRYSFANAVGEDEAKELYLGYSVPGAGEPLFQAAAANLNPWTEARVDSENPQRGPMLIISADADHTVPWAIAKAAYQRQKRNPGATEIVKMAGRGHTLTIDAGWRQVAEAALGFARRFASPHPEGI